MIKKTNFSRTVLGAILTLVTTYMLATGCASTSKMVSTQNPPIAGASLDYFVINRVVKSDTATVVDVDITFRPNWWIMANSATVLRDADGNDYKLKATKNIEIDKKFVMPESGKHSFSYIFEPLPKKCNVFSLLEPNVEESWSIYGIDISNKKNKPSIPKEFRQKIEPTTDIMQYANYKGGVATVRGKIDNFVPEMANDIIFRVAEIIKPHEVRRKLDINEDGTFTLELELSHPSYAYMYLPSWEKGIGFTVVPNTEMGLYIDSRMMNEEASSNDAARFSGTFADINNELSELDYLSKVSKLVESIDKETIANMSTDEIDKRVVADYKNFLAELENTEMSPAVKQFAKYRLTFAMVEAINEYAVKRYLSQQELMSRDSSLQFTNINMHQTKDVALFKEIDFSDKALYIYGVSDAYSLYSFQDPAFLDMLKEDNLSNIIKFISLRTSIEDFVPLTDKQLSEIDALKGEYSSYVKELNKQNDELVARIEEYKRNNKANILDFSNIAAEDTFKKLIELYPNKVLVIDVWETWCGPCIGALEDSAPVKIEMKEKNVDVVFIYIASESSPRKGWENRVLSIDGEHIYMTEQQSRAFAEKYSIDGVPTIFTITKSGKRMRKGNYRGSDWLRANINNALKY